MGSSKRQNTVSSSGSSNFRRLSLRPLGRPDTAFSSVDGGFVLVLHSLDAGISANHFAASISVHRISGISPLLVLFTDDADIPRLPELQVPEGIHSVEYASLPSDVWIGNCAEHVSRRGAY